jgi:hypothetical protein
MNKPDLARLYRRFTRDRVEADARLDVDALVALAEGDHSEQTERLLSDAGRSGLHADLVRFARALKPESARLGAEIERSFETSAPQHRGRNSRMAAPPGRVLRFATALTACLLAAVVVWSYQQRNAAPPTPVAAVKPVLPDRIFAALSDDSRSAQHGGDAIFHGSFGSDKIFKGEFNGG